MAVAADPDRHALLNRPRLERDSVNAVVRTAMRHLGSGPERAQEVETLVELLRADLLVRRLAELAELLRGAAEPGAEDHSPPAEDVQGRYLVREHLRPPTRDGRDRSADAHA